MGLLCEIFTREYSEVFEAELNGQAIYIAPFENGASATVFPDINEVPTCELAEMSDMRQWADYSIEAHQVITERLNPLVDQVFDANRAMLGIGSGRLTEIMNGGNLDIINPTYVDVFWADSAAEEIGRLAGERALMASDPEEAGVMSSIASDMAEVRGSLNAIMNLPQYNALLAADEQLFVMGATPMQIYELNVQPYAEFADQIDAPETGNSPQTPILEQLP